MSQPDPVAKAIRFGLLYGMSASKIAARLEVPVMTFKVGDRVLVKSASKRASRQARKPVLGTVIETRSPLTAWPSPSSCLSFRLVRYSVRIDHNKEVRLCDVRLLSPASIIDEIGHMA